MNVEMVYTCGKLLLSIVNHGLGERLVSITKQAGARGGTILMGKGTATNSTMALLGLGDSVKDIVFTLLTDDLIDPILQGIHTCSLQQKRKAGISVLIDVPHILKHILPNSTQTQHTGRNQTMKNPEHILIVCIMNKGYAEEAMAAARKAGAAGGTILTARGTGKEEDVKFFGIDLVPEKEMLLILTKANQTETILKAIKEERCFIEPGVGIAFCIDVEQFIPLGRQ